MVLQKAREYESSGGSKEVFNFRDLEAEAEALLDAARRETECVRRGAQEEALKLFEQSRAQGYEAGHETGLSEGRQTGHQEAIEESRKEFSKQSEEVVGLLRQECESCERIKEDVLWRAEQDTVELAVMIAKKVTKEAGLLHRSVATANVKAALELIGTCTDVVVRVNPQDVAHLETLSSGKEGFLGTYRHICFEQDESVSSGGCVIRTAENEIDGQLETQVERIAEELLMGEKNQKDKD